MSATAKPIRLLSYADLSERGIRISKSQLHRLAKEGNFPRPVKLGSQRNAWVESEVEAWFARRMAQRQAAE